MLKEVNIQLELALSLNNEKLKFTFNMQRLQEHFFILNNNFTEKSKAKVHKMYAQAFLKEYTKKKLCFKKNNIQVGDF